MTQPDPDTAFKAWWPRQAVRHNSRSPVAAREAFDAGFEAGRAAERQRIRQLAIVEAEKYDDVFESQHHVAAGALHLFADLLDGDGDDR